MARDLSHEDIVELLGAYALDAVDGDEEAAVTAHLAECARCRAEVAEYREVAATVAGASGDDPVPTGQWDRIAARLERTRPAPTGAVEPLAVGPAPTADPRGRHRVRWALAAVGAVAAALVVVLAVQVGRLDHRVEQLQRPPPSLAVTRATQAALREPGTRTVTLTDAAHRAVAEVVVAPSGASYFLNRRLPALAGGRTYQLWGFVGPTPISLGLLGGHPTDVAFAFDQAAPVHLLAVTAEGRGGAVSPTSAPVASGSRPT
jgi:anti-sigma factor RsiW